MVSGPKPKGTNPKVTKDNFLSLGLKAQDNGCCLGGFEFFLGRRVFSIRKGGREIVRLRVWRFLE